ncbi:MAG TPA: OmpH family outer membrane protein [Pyrinomonadaceae bacterium]|jgi:outer membrane protein
MKLLCRTLAALALLAAVSASSPRALAQQPAAPAGQGAQGKIAVIDSGAFSDEKAGILRLVNAIRQVEAQFQPLRTELQGLQTRSDALLKEIQDTRLVAAPATLAQKQDQAEQLQLQIKRKQEDGQAAYQKRLGELLNPLQQDVSDALTAYAKARGIVLVVDVSRVPVIYAADSLDITKDFIAEYNRTHPATAAAPAARP